MGHYSPVWSDRMLESLNIAKHSYHRIFLYLMQTPGSILLPCITVLIQKAIYRFCVQVCINLFIAYSYIWWQIPHLYDLWNINEWMNECDKYACMCMYKINKHNCTYPSPQRTFLLLLKLLEFNPVFSCSNTLPNTKHQNSQRDNGCKNSHNKS